MLRILGAEDVRIVSAARTPCGAFDGILQPYSAPELGGAALKAALEKTGMQPETVNEVVMGNVVTAGLGQNPAKQAAIEAGFTHRIHSLLVNTVCSAGMAAVIEGVRSILSGTSLIVAAGGMESRTNAPYLLGPFDRRGNRIEGEMRGDNYALSFPGRDAETEEYQAFIKKMRAAVIKEPNTFEALVCPFADRTSMKDYALRYAEKRGWDHEFVDAHAAESYKKAETARDEGCFVDEIVPVGEAKQDEIFSKEVQQALREKSSSVCSAYNAPSLGDGAAAVILAEGEEADRLGLDCAARVLGFSRLDVEPVDFIEAPVHAVKVLLDGLREAGDDEPFEIFEGNESFGLQIPIFEEHVPIEKQNVHGGAVALRHPLGASGARIVVTMLHAMQRYGLRRGLASICFASGGAFALAVELTE